MPSRKILIIGLVSAGIIIAASVVAWQLFFNPSRYNLGEKDELVFKLSEYFGQEPSNSIRITNETYFDVGDHDIYAYQLIADHDLKDHGAMRIFTYHNEMKVFRVSITWNHDGDPNLQNAGDLIVSGIADNTIPDWQGDDGQPNRNVEMLNWIHANANATQYPVVKNDFSQQRTLSLTAGEERISLVVSTEVLSS